MGPEGVAMPSAIHTVRLKVNEEIVVNHDGCFVRRRLGRWGQFVELIVPFVWGLWAWCATLWVIGRYFYDGGV